MPDDVWQDEDGVGRLLVFGVGEVGRDCLIIRFGIYLEVLQGQPTLADVLDLSLRLSFVLDANGAAASWWVGCHCLVLRVVWEGKRFGKWKFEVRLLM